MNRKKYKPAFNRLPNDTKIEVVAIKGDQTFLTVMTYGDFLNLDKRKGWVYTPYQIGYSQFKIDSK